MLCGPRPVNWSGCVGSKTFSQPDQMGNPPKMDMIQTEACHHSSRCPCEVHQVLSWTCLSCTVLFLCVQLVRRVRVVMELCEWKLWALIFLFAGKPSLALSVPLRTSVFHCGMLCSFCWTKESVNLLVICLSCCARVLFLCLVQGTLVSVSQGYDNYPFSISTVDMFIMCSVHLPTPRLFDITQSHAV